MSLHEKFGINKRIHLQEIEQGHIGILKIVKSRIIRKDAVKMVELAQKIWAVDASTAVSLICTDNICSKSKKLLNESGVGLIIQTNPN